jgi:MFS family permease
MATLPLYRHRPRAGRHRAGAKAGVRANPWWTLAGVSIGVIMVGLDASVVAIAYPHIALDLHASMADLQWITDAYMLALTTLLIFGGKLGDRFGRRRVFLICAVGIGLIVIAEGSHAAFIAGLHTAMIVASAAAGVGALLALFVRRDDRQTA